VGELIGRVIFNRDDQAVLDEVAGAVRELTEAHPLYPEL
jgi:hypothetical protein